MDKLTGTTQFKCIHAQAHNSIYLIFMPGAQYLIRIGVKDLAFYILHAFLHFTHFYALQALYT